MRSYSPSSEKDAESEKPVLNVATSRPKRRTKKPVFYLEEQECFEHPEKSSYTEAGYTFVNCLKYEKAEEEPLQIHLTFQALFLMNFHAHLFTNEIIGYNCGYVANNKNQKFLYIQDANICQALENIEADRSKTVEMDPESAREASNKAHDRDQNVIGWYHSHPMFDVNPSKIDVHNHQSNQTIFNNENKPFVGLIVGTYSKQIDSKTNYTSLLKCFYLEFGKNPNDSIFTKTLALRNPDLCTLQKQFSNHSNFIDKQTGSTKNNKE